MPVKLIASLNVRSSDMKEMFSTGSMIRSAVRVESCGTALMIRSCRVLIWRVLRASAASAAISSAAEGRCRSRRTSNGRLMRCVSRISGSSSRIVICKGCAASIITDWLKRIPSVFGKISVYCTISSVKPSEKTHIHEAPKSLSNWAPATAAPAVDSAEFRVLFDGLKARISSLEEQLASGSFSVKEDVPIREAPRPEALPEDVEYVNNHWRELMDSLPDNLNLNISEARRGITPDGRLELTWLAAGGTNLNYSRANDPANRDILDKALSDLTGKHVDVTYTLASDKRDLEEHHFDISQLITVEIETEDETASGYV